jgi:hypothetical protein
MIFDDAIIPEHNRVSSEWEKNEVIQKAYDRARDAILPRLMDLLEKHAGDGVWVASTDLFHNTQPLLELWTKPDYLAVHRATPVSAKDNNSDNNNNNIHGTTTQLFIEKQQEQSQTGSSATAKKNLRKGLPDKCLLRHDFSVGCHRFMVCKLRRRHQKEIAKHPSLSSLSSQQTPSPSAILDGLARSAVLKLYNEPSRSHRRTSSEDQSNNSVNQKELGTEAIETSDKDTAEEILLKSDGISEAYAQGEDPHHCRQFPQQDSLLQKETKRIVTDALSIVRAAKNLEVGMVPKTTMVRWKAEDEFEIRYFK